MARRTLPAPCAAWGGLPLPFDLTGIGAAGCSLYVRPDVCVPLATGGGAASHTEVVPSGPWAIGSVFFNQAWAVDASANPLGVVASNAAIGTVGAK